MTTIAYKNGKLAADSLGCVGQVKVGGIMKIAKNKKGDLAASAGDASYNYQFRKWFVSGEPGNPPEGKLEDGCFDRGVIFRKNKRIEVYEPRGKHEIKAPYYALGSGREVALGAMYNGADAATAIKAAIAHDPYTGGKIKVLKHSQRKK